MSFRVQGDDVMATVESVSYKDLRRGIKKAKRDLVFNLILYVLLILFAVVTLYPFIHLLACSFNEGIDSVKGKIHFFPRKFSTENYETIFSKNYILAAIRITLLRTIIGTLTSLFASALLSFILSRKSFLFKRSLSLFWIFTMYASAGIIPTMVLFRRMHLHENFWVYIIPGMVSVFNVMVMRTYMRKIPDSLEESAMLEGAGYMTVFTKIISPLCKPVYAATALFVATYHWNSWFDTLLYNRMSVHYSTLQYELREMFYYYQYPQAARYMQRLPVPFALLSAAAVIAMLPLLVAYPFVQRYFVSGLSIEGIKDCD